MKSSLRSADRYDNGRPELEEEGDHHAMYGGVRGRGGLSPKSFMQDGPMMRLPADLWERITTTLWTSEVLLLRSTGRTLQARLKVVTDAIMDGCRMIDHAARCRVQGPLSVPDMIEKLMTLDVGVRCEMFKRFAKLEASAGRTQTADGTVEKPKSVEALSDRYLLKRSGAAGGQDALAAHAWRRAVDKTKVDLRAVTIGVSCGEALMNLYVAEMYAPLLSVVADPRVHVKQVMAEAFGTLSRLQWAEFLFCLSRIRSVDVSIQTAQMVLVDDFDTSYPTPRPTVLASIVYAAMLYIRPVSVREWCLNHCGITPQRLATEVIPRITLTFVDHSARCLGVAGFYLRIRSTLRLLVHQLGSDDPEFAARLHRYFLVAFAEKSCPEGTRWRSLPRSVRADMTMKVLDLLPSVCELYDIKGRDVAAIWSAYFGVFDPNEVVLPAGVASDIDVLPWPLQATLWRLVADRHADPQCAFDGRAKKVYHNLTVERVDALCAKALEDARPALAIPALQAALKWEVTRACTARSGSLPGSAFSRVLGPVERRLRYLACTPMSAQIIDQCTVAERLPFVATLFSYRELLLKCGYTWTFDTMISADMETFLCDPTSGLFRPSDDVIRVLSHYAPLYRERLPEFVLGPLAWEAAFAKRFDLPLADAKPNLSWGQAFLPGSQQIPR